MLDVANAFLEQPADVLVIEGVDPPMTLPVRSNERELAQHPELVRDGRLLHPERLDELGDVMRALEQAKENPDAARRREREHRVRELLREPLLVAG